MNKVKGYRNMLGLTQQEMADKLNISKQSYNRKENNKTNFNDLEKQKIKTVLQEIDEKITIDFIFFE